MNTLISILRFFYLFETLIVAGELMFCLNYKFRKFGLILLIPGCALLVSLPFWLFELISMRYFIIGWFNVYYLVFFLMSMALFYACFKISLKQIVFFGTAAYTFQHFIYAATWIVGEYIPFPDELSKTTGMLVFTIAALVIFYFLLVRRVKKNNDVKLDNISLIIFSFAAVIAINIWNLYSRSTSYNGIPSYGYAIICCLLLFIIQFSLFERGKLEKEKEIIEKVVSVSGKQQFYSQNNIDLINRKCHDLKHSIEAMELMNDEERRKTISELKQAVMIYDNTIKTGNATLDAIFAEKSLICEKYNIDFSYMVDTNKLDFMEIVDLYTLFGNALDNAIESCLAEADKDKRIVTVNISQRNSLVSVCIQNYCKSEVDFQGDLPVTNKSDKENHGFGVKSMKYIVEKYKGSMVMKKEKDIFEVSMLFSVK